MCVERGSSFVLNQKCLFLSKRKGSAVTTVFVGSWERYAMPVVWLCKYDFTFHEQSTPRIDVMKTAAPSSLLCSLFYYHENLIVNHRGPPSLYFSSIL